MSDNDDQQKSIIIIISLLKDESHVFIFKDCKMEQFTTIRWDLPRFKLEVKFVQKVSGKLALRTCCAVCIDIPYSYRDCIVHTYVHEVCKKRVH